ncbi:MAG TPA: HAMP domain-containing sensor histidine kinase [Mycobacteriales bacterium]|nr:HAMP domain-containing sensor histidine kinase [Mycobacteriales bacterium]
MRRSMPGGGVRYLYLRLYRIAALAAAGVLGVLRRHAARPVPVRPDSYHRQVLDAEVSALATLRDASQIRDDLVASASHEFRTPLTAIRGSAITLLDRHDDIRPEDRDRLLTGIVEHADRLGRLLEDMLAASSAAAVDAGAVADVTAALGRFSLGQSRPRLCLRVAPGLSAHIEPIWLDQIVDALRGHLCTQARRDAPVDLCADRQGCDAAIRASYTPTHPSDEPARLFEPFASGYGVRTGQPASLALYVARRLTEMHGGHVSGDRGADGRVTLSVLLPAVRTEPITP